MATPPLKALSSMIKMLLTSTMLVMVTSAKSSMPHRTAHPLAIFQQLQSVLCGTAIRDGHKSQ